MCRAEVEEAQNSRSGADLEPNVSCAVLSEILRYLPNGAESHLARETQKRAECRFASPRWIEIANFASVKHFLNQH